jgi:hypothetical protein
LSDTPDPLPPPLPRLVWQAAAQARVMAP